MERYASGVSAQSKAHRSLAPARKPYFSGAQIRTIPARGGAPIRVYQRPGTSRDRGGDTRLKGGTWSPDGNLIVFSEDGTLYEIPARGARDREQD